MGLAVLFLNGHERIGGALAVVYGTIALFLLIFAVCRAWFDRTLPVEALAGLAVAGLALWVLL